jgi:putative glutamine amidotransferase
MYPDPERSVLAGRTLHYAEQGMVEWIASGGAVVLMIPGVPSRGVAAGARGYEGYAGALDGLVLQGGTDIAPEHYGEKPLRPEWAGDPARDAYEIALFRAFAAAGKPVLGICRGCQVINVARGGSLYQDVETQLGEGGAGRIVHRVDALYDRNRHEVTLEAGSRLARIFGGRTKAAVNSIHHQAVKRLGEGLAAEAHAAPDGVIEAVRGTGPGYVVGIQWHPEFMGDGGRDGLGGRPILDEFLAACAAGRGSGG